MQTNLVKSAIAVFALLISMATASASARAQKDGTPNVDTPKMRAAIVDDDVKEILMAMHHDRNGTVSQQEFLALMKAEFNKLDPDQSGRVNARELPASQSHVVASARDAK